MQCKRADHSELKKNGLIDLAQVGKIVARRAFRTLKLASECLKSSLSLILIKIE
jgi:hypothetical protein